MSTPVVIVRCPYCGKTVTCRLHHRCVDIDFFEGRCIECEMPVYVEDRRSYEQSGEVYIVLC